MYVGNDRFVWGGGIYTTESPLLYSSKIYRALWYALWTILIYFWPLVYGRTPQRRFSMM